MKITQIAILTLFLLVIFSVACSNSSGPTGPGSVVTEIVDCTTNCILDDKIEGTGIGSTMANFKSIDQHNQDVYANSYWGNVILINFSADWCGPCHQEAPELEKLYNEYKGRGLTVITLLISGRPIDWAQLHNLTFSVLDDNNEAIWSVYGGASIPLNIIVDRDQVIRYKEEGFNEDEIRNTIESLL